MDIKELEILGHQELADHWYYISKGRVMRGLLRGRDSDEVLDVGAGDGAFSRQLLDAGFVERAVCVDTSYEHDFSERHNGKEIDFRRSVGTVD